MSVDRARGGGGTRRRARGGGAGVGGNLESGDRTRGHPERFHWDFPEAGGHFLSFDSWRVGEGERTEIPKWRMGKQCEVTDDTWRARERQRTDE